MNWNEQLQEWKDAATPDSIIVLTDIAQMKMVLYGFSITPVTWSPPANRIPRGTDVDVWNASWAFSDIDMNRISMIARTDMILTQECFDRLKAARLIFPDGGINKYGKAFISSYAKKRLTEAMNQ